MLEEIEGRHILDQLRTDPQLASLGYQPVFVQGTDTFTGQDVGMLTRLTPISARRTDERVAADGRQQGVSKNLIARLQTPSGDCLSVVAVHLLSRAEDRSRAPEREAQAEVVRRAAVAEKEAGCHVIVAGDINDYDGEIRDPLDRRPVTQVIAIIRSMDPADGADDLVNPAARLPVAERYSNRWDRDADGNIDLPRDGSLIDHVLVSPGLEIVDTAIPRPLVGGTPLSDHDPVLVSLRPLAG